VVVLQHALVIVHQRQLCTQEAGVIGYTGPINGGGMQERRSWDSLSRRNSADGTTEYI
jgi:hypothetical protein